MNSRILPTLLLLAMIGGGHADAEETDLPIREITLYRSGVGYFEHSDRISGDQTWRLTFPTHAINDILKTMTLLDGGGGTFGPVRYGSKEPLDRRLASFGVDISSAPGSAELFSQLRGAGLRVQTADGPIEGTILGVEQRSVGDTAVTQSHVTLVTNGGVRAVNITDVVSYELTDADLAAELRRALTALSEQRSERTKTVELSFRGPAEAERPVMVSYVREMPVWKTSYRLVLPDAAGATPTMQGWAIVENTTDEDWKEVRLSLASGRPVSFTMDLYEPVYAQRPAVAVPLEEGMVPRLYESGSGSIRRPKLIAEMSALSNAIAAGDPAAIARMSEIQSELVALDGMSSGGDVESESLGEAQATGEQKGGQFLYTVDAPVTIERQRSAMLPILLSPVSGRRVSIFSPTPPPGVAKLRMIEAHSSSIQPDEYDAPEHPMKGVELTNDSKLHLMPGPIAVFDGGTYAGDAEIPHTARQQKRLLSYAMDVDVHTRTRGSASRRLVRISIAGGSVVQELKEQKGREYHFTNYDVRRGRTILVEHPKKNPGWALVAPGPADDETQEFYRFEVKLPPGGDASLVVTEENVRSTTLAIASVPIPTVIEYQQSGRASQAVVDALKKAELLQRAVRAPISKIQALERERKEIVADQARIRDNLPALEKNSDLHVRYIRKLTEQESRIEAIASEAAKLAEQRDAAQAAYDAYLRDLDVD